MLPMTSTIISYNFYLDGGLFANAVFPASIDKELVVDTILLNAGEFEPLYKDAEFMQHACEVWAKKWFHAFERWALALSEDYDPLYNYDRYEEIEEKHDDATTNKLDASTSTKDTNTNKRSAFDSNNYEPHDQSQLDGSGTSKSDASGTDKGKFERKAHLYGNIGVTKSTELLDDYWDFVQRSVVPIIGRAIANELCYTIWW